MRMGAVLDLEIFAARDAWKRIRFINENGYFPLFPLTLKNASISSVFFIWLEGGGFSGEYHVLMMYKEQAAQ